MQSSVQKAVIRKAAPAFSVAAWHENKIQQISLEQFKGMSMLLLSFQLSLGDLGFDFRRENSMFCPPTNLYIFTGKYVVLFFWPFDFTFVCPTEICQFNDMAKEFEAANCQVLGASIDSVHVHRKYTQTERKDGGLGPMQIPLLSDVNKELATAYGCLIQDDSGERGAAFRATYIIDKEGVLRQYSLNDLPIGRSAEEVLRLVKALAFTEEHGDVCPASWKPGNATMKEDHNASKTKDFWANVHAKK